MPTNDRLPGILALLGNPAPMQPLLDRLRELGMQVDVTTDVAGARRLFFGNGGHDCLVVAPDVRPGIASQVAATLRSVDPELPVATFGAAGHARKRNDTVLDFHPGSRAGTGALVRFLQAMRLR